MGLELFQRVISNSLLVFRHAVICHQLHYLHTYVSSIILLYTIILLLRFTYALLLMETEKILIIYFSTTYLLFQVFKLFRCYFHLQLVSTSFRLLSV